MSRKPLFSRFMAGFVSVISLVFFTLTLTTANAAPLATTVVTPATPNGWLWALESGTNGSVSFVSGPATPPAGTGSARLQTGNGATGVVLSRNGIYPGLRFDDITTLTYDLYKSAGSSSTNDVIFQFNVDYNLLDATTSWQGRLVYEPYYSISLPAGSWNTVDPLAGSAGWWATGAPGNGVCPISDPCTWAEVLTAFPNAGIQTGGLAAIHFKAGSGWTTPFDGNVDNLHIVADGGIDDTYDFDAGVAPGPTCTTTCYVSTLGNNSNGGASADDPLRTIQEGINRVDVGGTVVVAEGVYVEGLTLNKWLTLDGAGSGTDFASDTLIIAPTAPQDVLTINSGGSSATDRTVIQDVHFTRAVAPTATDTGDGVFINAGSFITFDTVASTLHPSNGFNFGAGPVNDLEILNSDLSGNFGNGWRSASGTVLDGFLLENSNVGNNRGFGLITGGGTNSNLHDNITLRDSTFTANYHTSPGLGSGDVSFFLYNGNLTVENVTINGVASPTVGPHIGFQLRGANTPAPSGTVVIDGLTITGNYIRPGGTPGNSFRLTNYGAGSSISINDLDVDSGNNSVGVLLSGLSDTTDLGNAVLDGLAVIAMEGSAQNPTAGSNATATGTTINGVSAGTATLPQLFAIEDVIYHRIDVGTPVNTNQAIGLARVRANNVYVTSNSFLAPVTTTPSIQRGVDAASVGDTVNVSAGAFNENITIPKSLTLDGVGAGTNAATHTIIEGNVPTVRGGNGITVNSLVTDVTIRDLRVQNFLNGNGIHATSRNDRFTADSVHTVNNRTAIAGIVAGGGIFMAGPVDTVLITNSESRDNNSRGIVIWDGYKSNITITNNIVMGNRCCGIELQDGTASGVTMTGNTVTDNADSGLSAIGLTDGDGPNVIADNTLTNNGRFGIEIKMPDGNGADAGDGSIVVENNNVSRSFVPADARDLAGISVYRRGFVVGNGYIDIPTGVIVRNNTVSGYQQTTQSDGFGIVVEGVDHEVSGNTLNNNDVGVQAQGGHLPYNPNAAGDGDQSNLNDQFFGRGNSPVGCPVTIGTNTFSGNSTDTRFVGYASNGYRATNIDTSEQFCTIQAAINDSDTINGHTIVVAAGTHVEQLTINKELTLEGAQAGVLAKDRVGLQSILRWSGSTPPISLADDNITIDGFVLNGEGANTSWIINAVGEPGNGVYENIQILNNEFIGDAGPHTAQNDSGGVYFIAATDVVFDGNYFNDLGSHAVFMGSTSDGTIYRNNDSYRNYLSNFSMHVGPHTDVLIENNRAIQDSMILFNMDGAIVQSNVFTATGTTNARIYMGGGSSNVTVDGNDFNGVRSAAIISFDPGFGYGGNSNITITDNTITATVGTLTIADVGLIDLRDTTGTNDVSGNSVAVTGGTLSVNSVRGISLRGAIGNTTITANTLSANNVDTSPATPSIGIYLQSDVSASSIVAIENNVIHGWNSGVEAGTLAVGLNATVFENDLSGNNPNAVANGGGAVLNASANWYGTNTPAGVDDVVSANVDYTPWFNVGTDTDGGTAGWQGDFSWFNADDTSPQTGAVGRINEAIALVTTGGTVNLAPGTYNETATVPKSLTLQGAGATTILDGNTPANQTGNGITLNSGVTDVTIQDLRVQDYGGTGLGSGIFGTLGNNNLIVQRTELYNNNLSNTGNGGGLYMNGPVNTVLVDDNDVVNNRSRGIVIWNGFKQNITITNNYVANNICCGIELQDGTATGVTVTGNTVENNGDSGLAFIGLRGPGANLIANNTLTDNGRFGIEIKLPDGNGTTSGGGSIVVEDNTVSRSFVPADVRDLAGISVYRRGWVSGNGNVDIPTGVIVRDNDVSGYAQTTQSDGFGIVVEGINHQVTNNTLTGNDVGIQVQGGHLPYTPNTNIDGDQSNLNDQFFGRGNAPYGCAVVTGNIFSGNTTDTRSVGNGGAGIRATNVNTTETFCTIQSAIDDADTVDGHTIEVAAGTWEEQVEVDKAITLEGQGEGTTTIVAPLDMPDFFNSGADNNYPVIYVHDVNATIRDMTVDGLGRGNLNYRFFGVAFEQAGGTLESVTITGMTNTPFNGTQHGNGIWGRANNGTDRTLTVTDVTITDFQKNGTVFTGADLTVTMDDSTVVGSGALGVGLPAQNGIQLSGGAAGSFDNNTISSIVYTPTTFAATGYLINGASGTVNVTNSTITDTTTAIYYINTQGDLTGNTIVNTPAGMSNAVYWWGAIVYNTTAAPFAGDTAPLAPEPFDTGDGDGFAPDTSLARSHTIEGNSFTGAGGGDGLSIYADAPEVATVTINENDVDDWEWGVYLDGAGTLNADVTANSITNNATGIVTGRGTIDIANNVMDSNDVGVQYLSGPTPPTVYENSITNSGTFAIEHANAPTVTIPINASANWYGTNTPAGVAGKVSALVDYTPWFNVGTDTDGGTAGWQGDFSWFNADDTSPQTGAVGRINEAIALVTTGGTVNLAAGTYNETATVPKSLTLQGTGATTILDGNTPANQTGNGITLNSGVTDVTIQDLRVQDYGSTGLGSGIFGTLGNNNLTVQRTELYNNNLSNTGNGGGLYMNGPVNTVLVDDNDVVNNRSRGIVIWNGFKQNITITNNYVANNICCGIELQDGTASGVTVTGNIVENNGDSGMAFVGLQGGAGANLIANNTVTNNGRFGIEIKLPNGNGATSGDGSIVVEFNTVSRTVAIPGGEQRDLAGISVYRRGYVVSEGNVDIPVGVVVRNNTVSGYAQPTTSDGFGIVVEGTNHNVLNNTLNNNDVGVQVQGGHLPYTPNTNIDGDQSNLNDQFFGRGNAPYGCAAVTGNIFSGNTTDTRSVGNGGAGIRATNMNTSESFCTIQAAIDDADTVAGHTVEVAAGTWEEQVEVHKAITLSGQGEGVTTILSPVTLTKFFVTSVNNYPIIYVHDVNATIEDMTVNGAGRGNNNNRFIGIGFRNAGGAVNRVTITDIRHTPISGIQGGVGIYALADNGTPRTLAVDDATITGFQKNGTAFNGVNLTATIANSTITGAGSVNFIAQNGVQWGFGATGSANNNTISDIGYTPTSDNGSGYLLYQATGTIQITNSDLEDLEVAAYAYDSALTFTGNTVTQTAAGLPGMPNWYGVFIASDVPAPLTPNATVQPFGEGASGGSANAVMNRSHLINANTMTSEGRGGTAIGTDVDAMEVTSINILTNTIEAWNVGIEFDGDGLLASNVDDNRIADNAVGIVIRTGVLNITNNAITEGAVGIRYFDSDGVEPEVHGNDIDYNTVWGIEHATFPGNTTIVDATSNYWGDPSGPLDTHLPFSGACPSLGEYNPTSTGNPVTECVRWAPPLVVTMANFEAVARPNDILVLWETASETDNLGFNLYRATSPDGTPEQLNEELIPSQSPGNGQGAMYEWADADVTEGVTYYYWLEAVDIYGAGSPFFGPVSATYGVPTAVTVSELNVQPATLPALLAAGLLIFGAIGVVVVRRRKA